MVATGRRLLEQDVHDSAVLFAGDMSWAAEYQGVIHQAATRGKLVTVVYPRGKGEAARENAQLLEAAGARVVPVDHDTRLRAMLVDHESPDEALLYVVNRPRGTHATDISSQGSDHDEYEGKIYGWKQDRLLITTATKLYQVLAP